MKKSMLIRLFSALLVGATVLTGCQKAAGDTNSKETEINSTEESLGGVKDAPAEIGLSIKTGGSYTVDKVIKGTVVIDTEEKLKLTLKNAVINSTTGPAIYVKNCKELEIVLEGESTLSDSAEYSLEQSELKGALFSEDDVVFTGNGSLSVTGNRAHAVVCDDGIVINSGNITIVSAIKDGVHANDLVDIKGGSLTVQNASGDGIECEAAINISGGVLTLNSVGDCIKASLAADGKTDCTVVISGGTLALTTKEDGIQSDGALDITGGTLDITTTGVVSNNNGSGQMQGGFPGGNWGGGTKPERPTRPGGNNRYPGFNPDTSADPNMPQGNVPTQTAAVSTVANDVSSKGIKSAGALTVTGGTVKITSTDDAVHSNTDLCIENGTFNISADDDAFHADGALTVKGGTIKVIKCYEGFEGKTVLIEGGDIDVTASDDGFNSTSGDSGNNRPGNANTDNSITVNGGSIHISSSGDGVDSNGAFTVNGGTLCIDYVGRGGNNALDADGTRLINGGTVVALGSTDMMENPAASSKQPVAIIYASVAAGSTVALTDSEGNVILCYTAAQSATSVTVSAAELKVGESYTLYTNVTPTGTRSCGGLYYGEGAGFTGGDAVRTFTQASIVTQARY